MIKVAICDDEKYFRETIKKHVEEYLRKKNMEFEIDLFESGKEFLESGIELLNYSVAFLDINMDELDGMRTAQEIRGYSSEMYIVFVTAYIDYSLEGYKVNAVRYLLKNNVNLEAAIYECMDTILDRMEHTILKKSFLFRQGEKEILLERLLYVESRLHNLEFYVMEEEMKIYTMYGILNKMEKELQEYDFVRVHQSYLVNLRHMKKIEDYKVMLSNGQTINIPKARYKEVKKAFITYKGRM